MSRRDHTPDSEQERVGVSDDIHETLDLYTDIVGHEDSRGDDWREPDGDPDADLFSARNEDKSLSETARQDTELFRNGTLGGARAYARDFVPPLAMWILTLVAIAVTVEIAIDLLGPEAGPLWEFRREASRLTLVAVTRGSELLIAGLRSNLAMVGLCLIGAWAIYRKRRW